LIDRMDFPQGKTVTQGWTIVNEGWLRCQAAFATFRNAKPSRF